MISSNTKILDLHGETRDIARILVNEFVQDCQTLGLEEVIIIHGIGSGKIKNEVEKTLKNNKHVERFYIDFWNIGQTIVKLKK